MVDRKPTAISVVFQVQYRFVVIIVDEGEGLQLVIVFCVIG